MSGPYLYRTVLLHPQLPLGFILFYFGKKRILREAAEWREAFASSGSFNLFRSFAKSYYRSHDPWQKTRLGTQPKEFNLWKFS